MPGVRWELAPRLRCDVVAFSGLNLSGERRVVEVHAVGGRQGDLSPEDVRSFAFIAPLGYRLVLAASDGDDWEQHPWRAVHVKAGSAFMTKEGRPCVRIPDLERLDAPDARRTDPELECDYDFAGTLAEGSGWTYGRNGPLKGRVRQIRIEAL